MISSPRRTPVTVLRAGRWQVRGPCRVWSPHLWISSWGPGLGGFLATADLWGLGRPMPLLRCVPSRII